MNAGSIVTIAPLKTRAPECSTTDSGAMRQALAIVVAYMARMKCVCWMPFGKPVVPRRVHERQQIVRVHFGLRLRVAAALNQRVVRVIRRASPRRRSAPMPVRASSASRTSSTAARCTRRRHDRARRGVGEQRAQPGCRQERRQRYGGRAELRARPVGREELEPVAEQRGHAIPARDADDASARWPSG